MEPEKESPAKQTERLVDARQHPRFKLDVDLKIYPRNSSRVTGRTADISEAGLAAILQIEVPLGQVVRLEFKLPLGLVSIRALVRQRNAFRYGLQFVEPDSEAQQSIISFCQDLMPRA